MGVKRVAEIDYLLQSDPVPEPCAQCWQRWQTKCHIGDKPGQVPFEVALEQNALPEFNALCPTCLAGFEQAIAEEAAKLARYHTQSVPV